MKIQEKFRQLKQKNEKALIGYITAGYPTAEDTIQIAQAMIKGGVDILELGLPFSDPVADGPTIQQASEKSLENGMNTDIYFKTAKEIHGVPKVCMTYYNLILQRGLEKFTKDCKNAGIEGIIVPDLPIEESEPLQNACDKNQTDLIYLAAPTTTDERLKKILKKTRGFLYVVSVLGVTGKREKLSNQAKPLLKRIKKHSGETPLALGFGISTPSHVKEALNSGADGVIIGSAYINLITENAKNRKQMLQKIEKYTKDAKKETLKQ